MPDEQFKLFLLFITFLPIFLGAGVIALIISGYFEDGPVEK